MAGTLISVWSRTWGDVWAPLARSSVAPNDLFRELIQGLVPEPAAPHPPAPPSPAAFNEDGELVDPFAIADRDAFRDTFKRYQQRRDDYETAVSGINPRGLFRRYVSGVASEVVAIRTLETAWDVIEAFERPGLNDRYRELVRSFFERYSLRYALREPFLIHATLSGLFSQLMADVKELAQQEPHLLELFSEFEDALSDLRENKTPMRMKACLQKQFVLLEGFAAQCPGVTAQTFGAMCDQLDWPHATIRDVGKKLYGFRSSYPALGHAGNAHGVLRPIGMRDFVSLSLMLAAFTPYVAHDLDPDRCYSAG